MTTKQNSENRIRRHYGPASKINSDRFYSCIKGVYSREDGPYCPDSYSPTFNCEYYPPLGRSTNETTYLRRLNFLLRARLQ